MENFKPYKSRILCKLVLTIIRSLPSVFHCSLTSPPSQSLPLLLRLLLFFFLERVGILIYLFISLCQVLVAARQLLSCSTWTPQLWQVGSLVVAPGLLNCGLLAPQLWHENSQLWHACGIQLPGQGLNPGPLHQERRVLSTAPPVKSYISDYF